MVTNEDIDNMKEEPQKTLIERAEELAERIENANKRHEEIVERYEKLEVEDLLSGTASAGQEIKEEKPKEITPLEMSKMAWNGEIKYFS